MATAAPAMAQPAMAPAAAATAVAVAPPGEPAPPIAKAMLAMGTPVLLMLDQDLDTAINNVGDKFPIVVAEDVVAEGTIVIPKGAVGAGEVTFLSKRGGFGKPGIIQIAVRQVELGDQRIVLDGRFREEGQSKAGATAATFFMVGILAGAIKGKPGVIERGRALRARLAEDFEYTPGAQPPAVPAFPQLSAAGEATTKPEPAPAPLPDPQSAAPGETPPAPSEPVQSQPSIPAKET